MAKNDTKTADKPQTEAQAIEQTPTDNLPATVEAVDPQPASVVTEGARARRGITMKQLLPNPDWINKNIVAGGAGTRGTVGRVWGVVTGAERKNNDWNGKIISSVSLRGIIQTESYLTGELAQGSSVFLPLAYSEQVASMFEGDPTLKVVQIDCDIGLEATGKTIPYEWVIIAFLEGKEMAVLKAMKNRRGRPAALLVAPDGKALQLEGPKAS